MTVRDVNRIPELLKDIPDIMDRAAARVGPTSPPGWWSGSTSMTPQWPALSEAWVRRKRSSKVYVDTGELRALLTYRVEGEDLRRTVKVGICDHQRPWYWPSWSTATKGCRSAPLMRPVADESEEAL